MLIFKSWDSEILKKKKYVIELCSFVIDYVFFLKDTHTNNFVQNIVSSQLMETCFECIIKHPKERILNNYPLPDSIKWKPQTWKYWIIEADTLV